jgi:Ser/Thr protein kinase RdoA (MazF antagonist)
MGTAEIDAVLTSPPPMFSATEAAAIARDIFGVSGAATATDSERDQTFLIDGDHATVLKISNAAEDPRQLDLEARAAQHIAAVDPALPVALPRPVPGTNAFRAQVVREGNVHWARLYDRLPGNASVEGASLSDEAIVAWGAMAARVGRALRGFFDPAAQRVMPWDVQHALQLRPLLETISDDNLRQLVSRALDRYEQEVTPLWPTLRHQVIHTDHCASNTLVDDEGEVTGIIDFGDASWSRSSSIWPPSWRPWSMAARKTSMSSSASAAWRSTATTASPHSSQTSGASSASCSRRACARASSSRHGVPR